MVLLNSFFSSAPLEKGFYKCLSPHFVLVVAVPPLFCQWHPNVHTMQMISLYTMYMDTFLCGTLRGILYFFIEADPASPLLRCLMLSSPHITLIKALGGETTVQCKKQQFPHHQFLKSSPHVFEFYVILSAFNSNI